jgi:hydrogenase maturation protease
MGAFNRPKTVALALGNLIRCDDGVGVHALALLEPDPRVPPEVTLVEGGTKGLELLPFVFDVADLLVLDAVDVGAAPGKILRITGQDLSTLPGSGSVHELALADILNALRIMGQQLHEMVLLGVQPASTELGTSLSPLVQLAWPDWVEAAIRELVTWNCFTGCGLGTGDDAVEAQVLQSRCLGSVECV